MGHSLGAGVRHVLTVDGGGRIDRDQVTDSHRPIHLGQAAEPGTQ